MHTDMYYINQSANHYLVVPEIHRINDAEQVRQLMEN